MNLKKIAIMFTLIVVFLFFMRSGLSAQGHFEFGVHYSIWSVNISKSLIEREIGNALETDFRDTFLDEIHQNYPGMEETLYEQTVSFDSGGENYGFEIRWFPGGYKGSFSIGLSAERTSMRIGFPEIAIDMELEDTGTGQTASFAGGITDVSCKIINATSFHLHLHWDLFPHWRIHPYTTFGVGAAFGNVLGEAIYSYTWSGDLDISGQQSEHYEDSETQTIQELKDQTVADGEEFPVPEFFFKVFPFIQSSLGLRTVLSNNFHVLVDVGFWNGFIVRGGIALRI